MLLGQIETELVWIETCLFKIATDAWDLLIFVECFMVYFQIQTIHKNTPEVCLAPSAAFLLSEV